MCACVLLRLKVRPNIPLPSLVFELAYFFPKKNKTLSLGFYSTHKSSRRSRPKNAKFETRARANAPRDRRRPISETDSKKERENNNRATPYKKIDDAETTEDNTLHESARKRTDGTKAISKPFHSAYILTMVRRPQVSRFVFPGSARRRAHATRDRAVFFAHSTEKSIARGLNAIVWASRTLRARFRAPFRTPPKTTRSPSLFSLYDRGSKTPRCRRKTWNDSSNSPTEKKKKTTKTTTKTTKKNGPPPARCKRPTAEGRSRRPGTRIDA